MDLGVSGLASGFDWRSMVDQLADIERAPQRVMASEQTSIQSRNTAYTAIQTQLTNLQARIKTIKDGTVFDNRSTTSSDTDVATATSSAATNLGSYKFTISQLATPTQLAGTSNVGGKLSTTNDLSSVLLTSSKLPVSVTAGTFTVNGQQVTVDSADTMQMVLDKIGIATGGDVTASYDTSTDRITLQGSGGIVLGSSADTSNFLTVARLNNPSSGTATSITSTLNLGGLKASEKLGLANFGTTVTDGGAGAGKFKVNGIEISYNATTDTLNDVISRINSSAAGVMAGYDPIQDRMTLTSKTTGNVGMVVEDVTGNFAAASGLSGGTVTRGKDLLYTLNDGTTLTSNTNTITSASSGVDGLTVTALDVGTVTVTVGTDTAGIKQAIKDFVEAYNKSQSTIDSYTASSTDEKGKVTAAALAADQEAGQMSSSLRSIVNGQVTGLGTTVDFLSELGYTSNGTDNLLSLSDESKLDALITGDINSLKSFFNDSTNGLAVKLSSYVESMAGDDKRIDQRQKLFGEQITGLDEQIAAQEKQVLARRDQMIASFIAMEQAQAKINQQMQFLQSKFGV